MVRVGINGFGRIGRTILRAYMENAKDKCGRPASEIVAINDPFAPTGYMAYLFRYDSTFGRYAGDVRSIGNCLMIDGSRIETTQEKDPTKIPWKKNCVDYVIEATGLFSTVQKASKHLASSDAPMFLYGVNHNRFDTNMQVVSAASCTTNCLAPLVKVVHDNFVMTEALMTTVHAVTPTQKTVDGTSSKQWRDGRGAYQNIIPLNIEYYRRTNHA